MRLWRGAIGGYHCRWRGISCTTSSQMCGRWYLPRFLLRGVIDSDVHGLHYGPSNALGLPIHYGKIVKLNGMTCGVAMVIDWGGGPDMVPLIWFMLPNKV